MGCRLNFKIIAGKAGSLLLGAAFVLGSSVACDAQEGGLRQPVYRVANQPEREGQQLPAAAPPVKQQRKPTFDLVQRAGEHPLQPLLRVAEASLAEIDKNVKDYSARVTKRERINGVLGEYQFMFTRIRHKPDSVYLYFLKPYKGREVLFVKGQNKGNLQALSDGWKRRVGVVSLDPNGRMAMEGQKYPITKFGIRKLTEELVMVAKQDVKFGECTVDVDHFAQLNGRPVTRIDVVHPNPRKNFRFHMARICIDNELKIPIYYASWLWPKKGDKAPPLEEEYSYSNIKINNGYTDLTFSKENPKIFKR